MFVVPAYSKNTTRVCRVSLSARINSPNSILEPKLTADVKDSDGWFHSGDVGEVDSKGRIKVIDRIKVSWCFFQDGKSGKCLNLLYRT